MNFSSSLPRVGPALVIALVGVSLRAAPVWSQTIPGSHSTARIHDRDRWVLENLCDAAGDHCSSTTVEKYGYRLSTYSPGLQRGDRVRPYASAPDSQSLRCWNKCSLYFLDLVPAASFAHPVVIGLYDRVTGDLQNVVGEMWPIINGDRHVLDTLGSRISFSIIAERGRLAAPEVKPRLTPSIVRPKVPVTRPPLEPAEPAFVVAPVCKVHAIVVNGYNSPKYNFDEDADGMYEVLLGLGVPDNQITYISPVTAPRRDLPALKRNLIDAITNLASFADPGSCDEFLFFLSTHASQDALTGGVRLEIRSGSGVHEWIAGVDLATLLSEVNCSKSTVVINSCKSGLLKTPIIDAMNNAVEPRSLRLYLSAENDDLSWADVDNADDPNPDDVGSETIWGYIEAFGASQGDASPSDGMISFEEATNYANKNDLTQISGDKSAEYFVSAAGDNSTPHECCTFGSNADLEITGDCLLTKRNKSVPDYGMSKVVSRCTNAPVRITVHNKGLSTIPVGTLRLHGSVILPNQVLPAKLTPYANVVMVTDLKPGELRTYEVLWGVRPVFQKGDRVALYASVDSPLDPLQAELCLQGGPGIAACQADQQSCLCEVSVVKRCLPIVGCSCKTYEGPEP